MYSFLKDSLSLAFQKKDFLGILIGSIMFLALSTLMIPLIVMGFPLLVYFRFSNKKGDQPKVA
jgi:hypothetical protein